MTAAPDHDPIGVPGPSAVPPTHDLILRADACFLRHADGTLDRLPVSRWRGESTDPGDRAFDEELVSRCPGTTIDLGCGPGRFVAALTARDRVALGVDHSRAAVAEARRRGAVALCRNIFDRLPGEGRWQNVLVMDGNVGIGGNPTRVLRRAATLIDPAGVVHVELDPDVEHVDHQTVRLESGGSVGPWFPWARLGVLGLEDAARQSALEVRSIRRIAEREVAELVSR
ncbi:class I SAM-dependent methyltransferase [Gordonia hankookensis]|uniref:class I SAM-dependent methyltransferase n=1 Tax=Gordonia hankookensis TaxID=589403 RepID=UPI001CBED436|nr:class I SAM-dependent methyltransferase [Gordonia hankookensis]